MASQSVKSQIYQSIANSQVQQVMAQKREQEIAQLQASFDAWNKQQDEIANLQAQYDSWLAEQPQAQPVQQATVNQVKEIPKLRNQIDLEDFFTPKTANGENINKRMPTEKDLARAKVSDIARRIGNNIVPDEDQFNVKKNIEESKTGKRSKAYKDSVNDVVAALNSPEVKQANALADYNKFVENKANVDKWLSPDYKLSDEERKAAKEYATAELQKFAYDSNKKPVNLTTQEDKQRYADMVNLLNKSNAFTNSMAGFTRPLTNLALGVRDVGSDVANQLTGLGAAIGDKLGITEGATKRHNEKQAENEAARQYTRDLMNTTYHNAQTQNPKSTAAGEIAGQVAMYALTNPLFDSLGAAAGLGKAGSFALNQVGQNAQDLALDTLPRLEEYKEGGFTDEEKKDLWKNVGLNAAGNLAMGAAGEGISALAKNRAAKKAADAAFQANAREGAEKLAKLAEMEDVDNVVRNATRQAEEAKKDIENLAKQMPETTISDISGALPNDVYNVSDIVARDNFDTLKQYRDYFEEPNWNDVYNKPLPDKNNTTFSEEVLAMMNEKGGVDKALNQYPNIETFYDGPHKESTVIQKERDNIISQIQTYYKNGMPKDRSFIIGDTPDILKKYGAYNGKLTLNQKDFDKIAYSGRMSNTSKHPHGLGYESIAQLPEALDDPVAILKGTKDNKDNIVAFTKLINNNGEPVIVPIEINKNGSLGIENRLHSAYGKRNIGEFVKDNPEKFVYINKEKADFFGSPRTGFQLPRLAEPSSAFSDLNVADTIENVNKESVKNVEDINKVMAEDAGLTPEDSFKIEEEIPDKGAFVEDGKSRVVTNSAINSDIVTKAELENDPVIQDIANYAKHRNDISFAEASDRVKLNGNQWKDDYISGARTISGDTDVDTSMLLLQDLKNKMDNAADPQKAALYANERNALLRKLREYGTTSGQGIQAFAKWNNTADGALLNATKVQEDDVIKPWISKNQKKVEGNSKIAKALADMGHKPTSKIRPELTHDQIKKGVIAELQKEVGSVEKYFNDNDIEYLTQLAEDKSIPVWQITSEIEHKLNTGNWYTLDESIDIPKPTNAKLQSALNSLVGETIRAEKEAPSLKEITEQVRNTLEKETYGSKFSDLTDDDIDYLATLIHEGASKEELANALNVKAATGNFGISAEVQQKVNDLFKRASIYDPNSRPFVELQSEAYKLLANEVLPNATALEKFEAWRYLAMLGNPKTMLRNLVGNALFNLTTDISNGVAALSEAGVDKIVKATGGEGIQRTKSILNPAKDADLIKSAWQDADASRYRQIIGSKYEKFDKDTLRQSKSVFNNKLVKLYEKATDAGISDYHAVKTKFSTSLAGYLKANGYDTNIFKAEDELARLKNLRETRLLSDAENQAIKDLTKDVEALENARDYALRQAEYATFHEDNKMAQVLSKWSRTSKEEGTGIGHVLIEGMIPFKKTPANVLRSGYEYSPLGAISSIKKTGKLIYENTGSRKGNLAATYINRAGKEVQKTLANDVIESWSKTLTGTGLTALGFYLFDKGILLDSDKDTKYQDQLEGLQNYSIKIGDKTYTVDWAAPAVMPLLLGAEIAKVWNAEGKETEHWYDNLDEYLNAVNMMAEPLVETSMLSGVRDNLKEIANSAKDGDYSGLLTTAAYNMGTGYLSQAIPTLSGQIARTVDNTRRSTYTDKEGVAGALEKQARKTMNKIPFLTKFNQPYIDAYGRQQKNSPSDNPLINLAYQMASPGYLADVNTTDADRMSREAYDISKNKNTLPEWKSYFKDNNGKRVSPEDYTKAATAYGEAEFDIRNALANDEWYNSLDKAQQEEIAKGINTIAEHSGNAAIDPEYDKNSKPYQAYKEGGIPKLLDYYKDQEVSSKAKELLGDSGVTLSSNAGKAVKEAVENGNMEQAEKLAEQAKEDKAVRDEQNKQIEESKNSISSYGLTSTAAAKTYEKAQTVISGLTAEEFAKTYKAIDKDGNQALRKKEEVIPYMNSQKMSYDEGMRFWKAYAKTEGKSAWKLPKLEDGVWK